MFLLEGENACSQSSCALLTAVLSSGSGVSVKVGTEVGVIVGVVVAVDVAVRLGVNVALGCGVDRSGGAELQAGIKLRNNDENNRRLKQTVVRERCDLNILTIPYDAPAPLQFTVAFEKELHFVIIQLFSSEDCNFRRASTTKKDPIDFDGIFALVVLFNQTTSPNGSRSTQRSVLEGHC